MSLLSPALSSGLIKQPPIQSMRGKSAVGSPPLAALSLPVQPLQTMPGFPPSPGFQTVPSFQPASSLVGGLQPQQQQVPPPLYQWVSQLGSQTQIRSDGLVQMNIPLIETLVRYREGVVPVLYQWLSMAQNPTSPHLMVMVESLYLAQRLAEERVSNVSMLYGITKHWNHTPHPLGQIYLAGFYRKLYAPETLGPLFQLLMKNALQPGPPIPPAFDPQEEIGGAILDLIARKAAEETWKKFQFPQPFVGSPPSSSFPLSSGQNPSALPPTSPSAKGLGNSFKLN